MLAHAGIALSVVSTPGLTWAWTQVNLAGVLVTFSVVRDFDREHCSVIIVIRTTPTSMQLYCT